MRKIKKSFAVQLVIAISFFCATADAQNIDVDILKGINPQNPNSQYWIQTSASAYWLPVATCFGTLTYSLIKRDKHEQAKAYELFISVGSAIALAELLKPIIHRTRPADMYPDEIFVNSPTHGGAFPSGHTALAFSTATTLALQYKKWYVIAPAYLWAGSVGYSRMYLGKHYPSDVLAGAAIGIGTAYLSHWLRKKLFKQ